MESVDNLVYSKRLRKPEGDITLFKETVKFIRLPLPPKNSSLQAAQDILTTQGATKLCGSGMEGSIKKHDKDPSYALKKYMDLFGLKYDIDYIEKVLTESAILIKEQKNSFNRPRPTQLAPYFGVDLQVLKSKTNRTPSYPSGHSTQSRLIAEIYGEKYPEHKSNLIRASEEVGGGRVMAGYHFPTDHRAGVYLAKRLFKSMKGRKKVTYDQSIDLTATPRRK
tara:strand:- start:174 stop:842 length:669 start_codon:yes stop_codon:yes gene_type:complete